MRVRVNHADHLDDLIRYLRATECAAEQRAEKEAEVSMPRAPSEDQARREVEIYLKAWQAMNPGASAEIVS
jgi:hypothetical protein